MARAEHPPAGVPMSRSRSGGAFWHALFAVQLLVSVSASSALASETEEDEPKPAPVTRPHLAVRGSGGFARGSLRGESASGVTASLGGGGELMPTMTGGSVTKLVGMGVFADLVFDHVETDRGHIGVHRLVASVTPELIVWRLHLGVGLDAGFLAFSRVSRTPGMPNAPIVGVHGVVAADLFTIAKTTISLGGRGDYGVFTSLDVTLGVRQAF